MLLASFHSFQHHHQQARQLQCAMHCRNRLFAGWRRVVCGRVGNWMQGPCLASTRRRLHLKGWRSEQQWHLQYETRRSALCESLTCVWLQVVFAALLGVSWSEADTCTAFHIDPVYGLQLDSSSKATAPVCSCFQSMKELEPLLYSRMPTSISHEEL